MHVHCPHCQNAIEIVEEEPLSEVSCPVCESSFSLVPEETETFKGPEVKTVGDFELVNRIGMGHFGTVWEARDLKLNRTVAVKIPRREQLSAADAEVFLREARAYGVNTRRFQEQNQRRTKGKTHGNTSFPSRSGLQATQGR